MLIVLIVVFFLFLVSTLFFFFVDLVAEELLAVHAGFLREIFFLAVLVYFKRFPFLRLLEPKPSKRTSKQEKGLLFSELYFCLVDPDFDVFVSLIRIIIGEKHSDPEQSI